MYRLLLLNNLPWPTRLPIKCAILALTVLAVCFPHPGLLMAHVRHWQDPSALIEPDAPAIQPLVEELRPRLTADLSSQEALRQVERFVYERIPYEWDWNTWGMADYLPTVTEAIEMGKEDCDGQAVVAASLLCNFGYDARLVTDFVHVWVQTDRGETMSPGKTRAVVGTADGLRVSRDALAQLPRAAAVSVAVFPPGRELVILAVLWLLMLRRHGGVFCSVSGLALFVYALFVLRAIGRVPGDPGLWLPLQGAVAVLIGLGQMFFVSRRNARRRQRKASGTGLVAIDLP